jgi:two-component system, NtrC family, sensor kinase
LVRYDFTSSNIDIVTEFSEFLSPVFGDPSQLQQVFLNLITNARHAMEKRKPARLTLQATQESDQIILRFKDTGCGIPKKNLGKIFDPFFTTKPVGKGTGLGLSISYGIIQDHHGSLSSESQEGTGTTFIIKLPAHHEDKYEPKKDIDRRR